MLQFLPKQALRSVFCKNVRKNVAYSTVYTFKALNWKECY